ncbi:hypothetical protein BDF20DRAFT_864861 [Mycotypha africana]|uniref:uncharacterized protein n=1 Tax=Mycotypha africana TaxID=64632 RepID=UPI0023005DEA|nr:uncharacterized protein BDF20DRAFT_864861 [Mycotypha africana]KAI8982080.1 hypothetical protein BDF20DRAFT_864861 [Mycotypha africana]
MFRVCICPSLKSNRTHCTAKKAFEFIRHYKIPVGGAWTPEEDALLRNYKGSKESIPWKDFVEQYLPNRTVSQCKSRWNMHGKNAYGGSYFNLQEKQQLLDAVQVLGTDWERISATVLPHRPPERLCDEYRHLTEKASNWKRRAWSSEEDNILLKAAKEHGPAWTHISRNYLPYRAPAVLRNRYCHLMASKMDWPDEEVALLEKLAIQFDYDWSEVAKKFSNGRRPEHCLQKWLDVQRGFNLKDKSNNSKIDAWTEDEVRVFWETLDKCSGDLSRLAHQLPGRNDHSCRYKFWATLCDDDEFLEAHGKEAEQSRHEFPSMYRARIARLYNKWLHIKSSPVWPEDQLEKLQSLVKDQQAMKKELLQSDWEAIAKEFPYKSIAECKYQYNHYVNATFAEGGWNFDELLKLVELVYKYKMKTQDEENLWEHVAKELNTGHSANACQAKYNYMKRIGRRFVI